MAWRGMRAVVVLSLAAAAVGAVPQAAARHGGGRTLENTLVGSATFSTTDGRGVLAAVWETGGGYTGGYGGPAGARVISFESSPDFLQWTTKPFSTGPTCGEEPILMPTWESVDGQRWLSADQCFDRGVPSNIVLDSLRLGLVAPLAARAFDVEEGKPGEPVVFHDWTIEDGISGCGTGFLGARSTEDGEAHLARYPAADYPYIPAYSRGVEARSVLLRPHHLLQWFAGAGRGDPRVADPRFDARAGDATDARENGGAVHHRVVYAKPVPDISPPVVTITSPADCAQVAQGEALTLRYTCEDPRVSAEGPDTVATCLGPVPSGMSLDTSTPGEHVVSVTGTDLAGNSRTQKVRYTVQPVVLPEGRIASGTAAVVRSLTSRSGAVNGVWLGEEGLLTVSLSKPIRNVRLDPINPDFPEQRRSHADGTPYPPVYLAGVQAPVNVPLWRERRSMPTTLILACAGRPPTTGGHGGLVQRVECGDFYPAGPIDVYLPVTGTETGTFRVGPGDGSGDLTITVAPTIEEEINRVRALGLAQGIERSLLAKLEEAQQALERDNVRAACGKLGEFIDQVKAQSGKAIDSGDAEALVTDAGLIRRLLGCK